MSDNLKKRCFTDLTSEGRIRIPKIQRDYAQGRKTPKVNEIRKTFVHTLLLVVKGKSPSTELEFIYGSTRDGAYEPLDGQQRLTTLFLLHWIFGTDLSDPEDRRKSLFTYETRNTSSEFCDELVQHQFTALICEAREKGKAPSEIIWKRDWFKWEWQYDPTIISMLVMIDSISEEMEKESGWTDNLSTYRSNLKNITFNNLNLGEFGLSDELFIKMNARGKLLSDFDTLKSTLEEELQIQQDETSADGKSLASPDDETNWRSLMDGTWIDFFWHKYARNVIIESGQQQDENIKKKQLEAARHAECRFKILLLRLIALQMLENVRTCESLIDAAYRLSEDTSDNLMTAYIDSLLSVRSGDQNGTIPDNLVTINFKLLTEDVNSLIYRDSENLFHEMTDLLPVDTHIDKNKTTLFDSFLNDKVAKDVELVFYGMILFLRLCPVSKDISFDSQQHLSWIENFGNWVRSLRNILLNVNNNSHIDTKETFISAMRGVSKIADDLYGFARQEAADMETDSSIVLKFFRSLEGRTYPGLDNQSVNEEIEKARLRLSNDEWTGKILHFEAHEYLWGQIRCLLNWSAGDVHIFEDYGKRLTELFDFKGGDHNLFYAGMLAFDPDCWNESKGLFLFNTDRDNSIKRCLRDINQKKYSNCLKRLIDFWKEKCPASPAEKFINGLIDDRKASKTEWNWTLCILEFPSLLDRASKKKIFINNGHVILAQLKTQNSHCFDPIFLYFQTLCSNSGNMDYDFYDSTAKYSHGFEFEKDEHKYLILWGNGEGEYSVSVDEGEATILSADAAVRFVREKLGLHTDRC